MSRPAVSVPAVSVPAVSVPAVSVPAVSVPAVSVPAVSVPAVSVPAVSVVVPVYNGARTLAACLEAIGRQRFDGETELVVVDNGSTDATRTIIGRYGFARMVCCAASGPAAARNAGIAATRHPIIAFTDCDCIPASDWLAALTEAARPELAGIGGRLESAASGPVQDVVAAISFNQRQAIESSLPYVITANCLFRRAALAAVGGFDETFPIAGGEDTDLGWRLAAAGARFGYADAAVCLHDHPARLLDLASQRVRYGYAMSLLWSKYRAGPLGPPLAAILPSWATLCLSLARPDPAAGSGAARALRVWAQAAYFAGWVLGGGRAMPGSPRPAAPDRRAIMLASPVAALACAAVLAAMVLTGRSRRIFGRRPKPATAP